LKSGIHVPTNRESVGQILDRQAAIANGLNPVIASAAKQSMPQREDRWIASLRSQ
jgi:hypothetical protein